MADRMRVLSFERLLAWVVDEYEGQGSIFGIHRSRFASPRPDAPYAGTLYGRPLGAPVGPAAGPHTQLAQNILCAWLCGGRFIELKTVQVMEDLEIPRPCIDAADVGYNVEWSQELDLEQSAGEYVKAWALIHVLRRLLGIEAQAPFATQFNMSVGYDLAGIQSASLTRFMDRLQDAAADLAPIRAALRAHPRFAGLEIPDQIATSVTLSTMHGCPPDEIERIARYLLVERGLHTIVKLNPTLLGADRVRAILHDALGYDQIQIPDAVFEHDLSYDRARRLIASLRRVAAEQERTFGVKLSNTLAMANHRGVLPGEEMYMSGRALYPITLHLLARLAEAFDGALDISYSAGADAWNVATILSTGARPVTVATDLLQPGGYARLGQYLEQIEAEMAAQGARSLDELARDRVANAARAAEAALHDPRYARAYRPYPPPKVSAPLGPFDCVAAPCVEQCAVCQDVPAYAWWIAQGDDDRALQTILARNPLPGVTGHVCTHLCQTRCTRSEYDRPVAIRALKRFAAERGEVSLAAPPARKERVAVIGSGPSGLAAAYYLALSGVRVTVYEAQPEAGGMLALAPAFRLPRPVVQADIDRILRLGVALETDHPIGGPPEALLERGFDAVYVACGFPHDAVPPIEGIEGPGVYTALDLLRRVARGQAPPLGRRVLVVGGGNTAMDAARTAQRLTGRPVTVVYRRTQAEMPADREEVVDLLVEGNEIMSLAAPRRVERAAGAVVGLACVRTALGAPGPDGRRQPVPVEGSGFTIEADTVILATGQRAGVALLRQSAIAVQQGGAVVVDPHSGATSVRGVYAGGDAVRGPAIIIAACADGRRAAEAICDQLGAPFCPPPPSLPDLDDAALHRVQRARARKAPRQEPPALLVTERGGFDRVEGTLSEEAARQEATRCLQCASICEKCVEVCPNRANWAYEAQTGVWSLPVLACREGALVTAGTERWALAQRRQIVHLDALCNECGNCATFCVHQGQPYRDKPRLFDTWAAFEREDENAYDVTDDAIYRRAGGATLRLAPVEGGFEFETPRFVVHLGPDLAWRGGRVKAPFAGPASLVHAAEMAALWRGIRASLPFVLH